MRRVGGSLVLVLSALSLAASASAAPTIDWKGLPYFDYALQRLELTTDDTWSSAHVARTGPFKAPKGSYIWTATCFNGEQRVSFSKTIYAPGEPLEGRVQLDYGPGNQLYGGRPYKSAELLINGTEAAQLGNINANPRTVAPQFFGELSRRVLAGFRYGANTITVRVVKAALKKGERCVDPRAPRYVAVFASLNLQFGSDLRVLAPRVPRRVLKNVMNGEPVRVDGVIQLANAGPSASLQGRVVFQLSGPGRAIIIPGTTVSAPLECTKIGTEGLRDPLDCPYVDFRAGKRATIDYKGGVKVNHGYFRNGMGKIEITADITSRAPDPKLRNNRQEAVVILCAPAATDPVCR
jgi:hypothetical protein